MFEVGSFIRTEKAITWGMLIEKSGVDGADEVIIPRFTAARVVDIEPNGWLKLVWSDGQIDVEISNKPWLYNPDWFLQYHLRTKLAEGMTVQARRNFRTDVGSLPLSIREKNMKAVIAANTVGTVIDLYLHKWKEYAAVEISGEPDKPVIHTPVSAWRELEPLLPVAPEMIQQWYPLPWNTQRVGNAVEIQSQGQTWVLTIDPRHSVVELTDEHFKLADRIVAAVNLEPCAEAVEGAIHDSVLVKGLHLIPGKVRLLQADLSILRELSQMMQQPTLSRDALPLLAGVISDLEILLEGNDGKPATD